MANRNFSHAVGHLDTELVLLSGSVLIGAVGAVTSSTGTGVSGVTKDATGTYGITLSDAYSRFLGLHCTVVAATAALSGISSVEISSDDVQAAIAAKTPVVIKTLDAAGAAANPISGATIYFTLVLRNSSVKGRGEA